ncbi:MAG: hypothetical protein HWD59_10735 [Coxiellaceae bacterium]|nr:MAG: hypothetical protein HWD59_10735 [Coxiellaceae bacterium]
MAKTAEQLLAEVIVEKFEFLLSPTWQQENKSLSRSYPSFFASTNSRAIIT